ncbi:MAG: hypothetical protein D3916_03765 [Candidatus Electrothrix sp. MAN1_4]|nr:hypothetical protein [Candidatus Electrothrix sp. MAN1_4]
MRDVFDMVVNDDLSLFLGRKQYDIICVDCTGYLLKKKGAIVNKKFCCAIREKSFFRMYSLVFNVFTLTFREGYVYSALTLEFDIFDF